MLLWAIAVITPILLCISILLFVKYSHIDRWIVPYIQQKRPGFHHPQFPIHVYVAICDHFEPFWGGVSQEIAEHRVATWCREYQKAIRSHIDSSGKSPVHTFFYSETDYHPLFIDSLSKLCKEEIADVELLIRHDHDTPAGFRRRIEGFRDTLFFHHGLLRKDSSGKVIYGFIHGNGTLNNARPDKRLCGVDNEIPILKDTGCYADFTFPTAPDSTQPPIINSIYFAQDTPGKPCAHEHGYAAGKNIWSEKDHLIIQGPLGLNWHNKKWMFFPQIENGELSFEKRVTSDRLRLWMQSGIHVAGIRNHLFVKLSARGTVDSTIRYFFGEEGLHELWTQLEHHYNDNERYVLHYVSAWEMYAAVRELCTTTHIQLSTETSEL